MYKYVPTLTDFILHEERRVKNATGSYTILMTQIENAVKIINSHIRESGLVDILGKTGEKNAFNEEVQKLDAFSNNVLVDTLTASGQVHAIVSEELKQPLYIDRDHAGDYIVYFNPLDGSSNIETGSPVGTIFSIYKKADPLLCRGEEQIAAGYVIYGATTMFVYTFGHGVHGFTLDPSIGSFLLSHEDMKIPQKSFIYSINEANADLYYEDVQQYLLYLKRKQLFKLRYVGSFVADVHRTLIKGGIFLYPADRKQPAGKLRLMLEVNPMAFIVEQAGGLAVSTNGKSPLAIEPESIHARAPIVLGTPDLVREYQRMKK